MQGGSRKAWHLSGVSDCGRARSGRDSVWSSPLSRSERRSVAFSRLGSPIVGSTFLDESPHGFGMLRGARCEDHLLGLVIQ
jgi:hypothetical protein